MVLSSFARAQSDENAFIWRYQDDIWSIKDQDIVVEQTPTDLLNSPLTISWDIERRTELSISVSDTGDLTDVIEVSEMSEISEPVGEEGPVESWDLDDIRLWVVDLKRNQWVNQAEVLEWLYLRPVEYDISDGTLEIIWRDAPEWFVYILPLEHTDVEVHIAGFVSRTTVTHTFTNPYATPIEASYMFPLWSDGAVDHMQMQIWNRTIIWSIKEKEQAEAIYQQAKAEWKIASILDQNRPNVFTQRVANILPGAKIEITISYFEPVRYDGEYTYIFPMVVGPKFNPWSVTDPTDVVSPQIPSHLTPYDITMNVNLDAGTPVVNLKSETHDINIQKETESVLKITFAGDEIPNKDFAFTYWLSSDAPNFWTLFHKEPQDEKWFVALTVDPQIEPTEEQVLPKEIIFVLDSSGSMMGNPLAGVKSLMTQTIQWLQGKDSFNIIDFNSGAEALFVDAVPVIASTKEQGQRYVDDLVAWGWTNMHVAFDLALEQSDGNIWKARIVVIMTDGDVWNEDQVLNLLTEKLWNNKVFVFWVDTASNTYLLDKIAEVWKWKSIYAYSSEELDEKVNEFYESFRYPLLTDIEVDRWDARVDNVLPRIIPDLYAGQPLRLVWQFEQTWESLVTISGKQWSFDFSKELTLVFPEDNKNDALKSYRWREKIDEMYKDRRFEIGKESRDGRNTEYRDQSRADFKQEITDLWINYHILTEYTSFVAVDHTEVVNTGELLGVEVPIYGVDGKQMQGSSSSFEGAGEEVVTTITTTTSTPSTTSRVMDIKSQLQWTWWSNSWPVPSFNLPTFLPQTWAWL